MSKFNKFVVFVAAHYVADAAQTEFMALHKAPKSHDGWIHILAGHCFIQALCVLLAALFCGDSKATALRKAQTEFVAHYAVDTAKGCGRFGFNTDQAIHLLIKLLYI